MVVSKEVVVAMELVSNNKDSQEQPQLVVLVTISIVRNNKHLRQLFMQRMLKVFSKILTHKLFDDLLLKVCKH